MQGVRTDERVIDVSPLFQPLRIRDVELPNRFVMPAMTTQSAPGGEPTADTADYFRARVEGGTALIISGAAAVDHPSATWQDAAALVTREKIAGWRRCIQEVRQAGGVFLVQLWHEGAIRKQGGGGPHPDAPSLSPSGLFKAGGENGQAATLAEIEELKQAYARSAQIAVEAGAHGVELHAAHGYLLDQFLWADTNLRDDDYGGALFANRVRFVAEVVEEVRRAIGPAPLISVRFSQWKEVDYEAKIFQTPEELRMFVEAMEAAGADLLHPSTRRVLKAEWPDSDLGLAGWTKSMTSLPVIAVGSVGLSVDLMETFFGETDSELVIHDNLDRMVARFLDGEFDLVAIGRSNLADPDWVEKVRQGHYASIRPFSKVLLAKLMEEEWDTGVIGDAHQ